MVYFKNNNDEITFICKGTKLRECLKIVLAENYQPNDVYDNWKDWYNDVIERFDTLLENFVVKIDGEEISIDKIENIDEFMDEFNSSFDGIPQMVSSPKGLDINDKTVWY